MKTVQQTEPPPLVISSLQAAAQDQTKQPVNHFK